MALNATQLSALSRLFSASVLREMAKKGNSPLFARLLVDTGLLTRQAQTAMQTVSAAFEAAFADLNQLGKRDEYVYRAALTHKILLGIHSLNTASMLTEFRVGNSKADVVILNGTSTVYEIKSERDSLARLENQIFNYRKVFAKIYVIAAESHVQDIINCTSSDIGVMSLGCRNRISTKREATEQINSICPVTIFESLRSTEASMILRNLGIDVPDVPNTMLYSVMRECFSRLAPEDVHQQMVQTLKKTRKLVSLSSLVDKMPKSLQPAVLTTQLRRADHERLIMAINTPLDEALNWT
ncbi:sce7726 family protein [Paludibacterium yongneupense]|uniref:sce7726 family protein n=1 Tax=Paludibacterium yongneupense TaxID=400061 RepID=UPI0009FDE426|nr:sce7726 family protein [Paludibacterium yongneupense]